MSTSDQQRRPYFRLRMFFGCALAISTAVLLAVVLEPDVIEFDVKISDHKKGDVKKGDVKKGDVKKGDVKKDVEKSDKEPNDNASEKPRDTWGSPAIVISLVATATSLLGFISNTLLMWRKERRDAQVAALKHERGQIEIERLRRELDATRSSQEDDLELG